MDESGSTHPLSPQIWIRPSEASVLTRAKATVSAEILGCNFAVALTLTSRQCVTSQSQWALTGPLQDSDATGVPDDACRHGPFGHPNSL